MKGYSFRSLTDLVLKIFKTKVNAGTGLSGGGSLEADRTLTVKYGTAAGTATQGNDSRVVNAASNATVNAKEAALETKKADKAITITAGTGLTGGGTLAANRTLNVSYGTAAGTAAQGNDSRLSNSREWTAGTISQAEAQAGTATTRRAFTAQRVRQAIVAWWSSITGVFGRDLVTSANNTVARSKLGLGTAATRNVGENAGQVMQVGAFGLGGKNTDFTGTILEISDFDIQRTVGFYAVNNHALDAPTNWIGGIKGSLIVAVEGGEGGRVNQFATQGLTAMRTWFRGQDTGGSWTPWLEIFHTGNILQTTGSSTDFPMSQKVVTDQLATKAALSHTHPWSQVTGQPATATRWPSFAEVTGKPATYAPSSHTHPVSQVTGLGSAATRNVGTGVGQVMEVGAFGLGGSTGGTSGSAIEPCGFGYLGDVGFYIQHRYTDSTPGFRISNAPYADVFYLESSKRGTSEYRPSVIVHHSGNLLKTTGSSSEYPMSQKAVTDQLATKAIASRTITAGTGLTGGGNLSANRTLSIAASHIPIGVGQSYQNLIASRAWNTTYTNTSGRPIFLSVSAEDTHANLSIELVVSGVIISQVWTANKGFTQTLTGIIPAGATYRIERRDTNDTITYWMELAA